MPKLTIEILKREAKNFSRDESRHKEKSLFGITDGKAVGTYLEHKFKDYLRSKYKFEEGNAASGIDFPGLQVGIKTTNINQPYSSYPFKSVRQKIFGFEYSILMFVFEKTDNPKFNSSTLNILYTLFMSSKRTGDFQTTRGLTNILDHNGNKDDLMAFMFDKYLLASEVEAGILADEILANPPIIGLLTISPAWQWRLQYSRSIEQAEDVALVYRANRWAI